MGDPVNLSNLRSMTDGDPELERVLFDEFFSSFEEGISVLDGSTEASASEIWYKQSHALKGIALNLGAEKLGELCKKGQEEHQSDAASKGALLKQIHAEYAAAKQFLLAMIAAL